MRRIPDGSLRTVVSSGDRGPGTREIGTGFACDFPQRPYPSAAAAVPARPTTDIGLTTCHRSRAAEKDWCTMSRTRYWLCAAIPLVIALTKAVGAEGLAAEPAGGASTQSAHVSLDATNVTLDALARLMSESLGCEVRIEGVAT